MNNEELKKRVEQHRDILDKMNDVYEKKNIDYGDSFSESCDEFGIIASVTRISDKYRRFKQLSLSNANLVEDESIEDTLLDMANYAIMTVMWLKGQK